MLRRVFGRRLVVALAVGGAMFGVATAVQASIPDSSGIVHACFNTSLAHGSPTGALRAIDTSAANGNCASWEGAVDLATPQYVQSVVASTVNQTAGMFSAPVLYNSAGDWETTWTCPSGYIGIDAWVQSNEYFGHNHDLTVKSEANLNSLAAGPPGRAVRIYYNIAANVPWTFINGVTCVDGRVYGQPNPAAPPAAGITATMTTQHD
ncbi:MAG TPA: hypothetical protein VLJ76_05285 [Gaiellaceae bacterium]|nr:hypothetical protein [Gaiellaceae bacterium]